MKTRKSGREKAIKTERDLDHDGDGAKLLVLNDGGLVVHLRHQLSNEGALVRLVALATLPGHAVRLGQAHILQAQ